jgi:hypothetical protein
MRQLRASARAGSLAARYPCPMKRNDVTLRIIRGSDPGTPAGAELSAPDRLRMMWQLTLDAWAFKGDDSAQSRLPRHVVRVERGRR